jgi:hypothetical protein
MTTLDKEAQILRRLVAANDFAGVQACAARYGKLLRGHVAALPPAQAPGRLREACALLEWARRTLCAARAGMADDLQRLHHLTAYHATARPAYGHTWRVEG